MGINLFRPSGRAVLPWFKGGWVVALLASQILLFFGVAIPLRNAGVILLFYGRKAYFQENLHVADVHTGALSDGSKLSVPVDAGTMCLTFLICGITVIQLLRLVRSLLNARTQQ